MSKIRDVLGNIVLSVGHVAGMIDMVALPLWVGSLIKHYGYSPAEAGGVVTLFLFSVVAASTLVAPVFERLPHRLAVTSGFAVAAVVFFAVSRLPVHHDGFALMAILHVVAGLGVGTALSITHGKIGRTDNPHRLFGLVNVALGVLGVITFAALPMAVAAYGPQTMFVVFALVMAIATVICAAAFPGSATVAADPQRAGRRVPASAWFVVGVIICMTFNQAMIFSFLEQLGLARGFAQTQVNGVLIALGFINLVPGLLAALLQRRLPAIAVGFAGPIVQATLALGLTHATSFAPYAVSGAVFVSVLIFTHTFLFGLLSRLDTSGRCVAATPAMTMIGSCTGPAMGGLIVTNWGFGALGWTAVTLAVIALGFLTLLRLQLQTRPVALATAGG
jgi:predicted MFS family arabinose efflux permease